MSEIRDIFYNLFWQSKVCRNIFLLPKEELLDTQKLELDPELKVSVSYPRIIISNVIKNDEAFDTLKIRTESDKIRKQNNIQSKVEKYQPLITNFFESKFGKSLQKLTGDLESDPSKFLKLVAKFILAGKDKKESIILDQLKHYGFIGNNIKSLSSLEANSEKGMRNILRSALTEDNLWNINEFIRTVKDLYTKSNFEGYYSSNQVLVNALFSDDDFQSRIVLFNKLYDIGVISPSNEDAFVECVSCPSGTYHGSLQLKLSPNKLTNLVCPVCSGKVNYYIPYHLNDEIYKIINSKDGLLLDALTQKLHQKRMPFKLNQFFLGDVEIDCMFQLNGTSYIVESKMLKQNTTKDKLEEKINEAYLKLLRDVDRLLTNKLVQNANPILLVNIPDQDFLNTIRNNFENVNISNQILLNGRIANIDTI